nr:hypothetical protein [Tanacetum cinerariifolium]
MHTIVWRNRSDLDTMSLDDLYIHLKALLSMRADRFWKKTRKKISIQGTDVAGFDKSKVECFNFHKMGYFTREYRAPRSQDRGRRDNYRQGSKVEEQAPKALMAIDGELELIKKEKEGLDSKLTGFQTASKDLDSLLESQKLDKNKEGLGYSVVPPPPTQIYSPPKKDMSWTGLPEFKDEIVTDYSRLAPTIESSPDDAQKKILLNFSIANRKFPTANRIFPTGGTRFSTTDIGKKGKAIKPSAGNIPYLSDYEPFDGGYVSFGQGGCKITGKGTIKTGKLEFENVYLVKDLKYNLFSVTQICDNKYSVLVTDSECIVLGQNFKLSDDDNVFLRTPRQHSMYSIDLNNIIPHKDLTCLVSKASADECMFWHRRLDHLNFKTMNKLVRYNLVRGLPTKCFENDNTCTACLKVKQHKASLTDDFSRFTWTFFLKTKDETIGILRKFITEIENLKDLKVKIIRCDNGGEFRNKEMNHLCSQKGIKREFSNARTPQQNGVAEKRNKTLIEAARTMVLVNKSQNKTPYELFNGRTPAIGFLKPFGCHVMISNTLDNLGKFVAKGDEGYFIGYSMSSKEFRVHDALLESSSSKPQDYCSTDVSESSGNSNPTATLINPPADQLETLTVETPIPTVSSPVPTTCLNDSLEPSIDSDGVEADVSNMETTIIASPTPTIKIYKDHPKSQIIGPVDTPIQTKNKSKEVGEQSFIATIHQKTDPALLQFCLFSCFLSQVEPKKILDALQDLS